MTMKILSQELMKLQDFASGEKWVQVAQDFSNRNQFVIQALDTLSVQGTETGASILERIRTAKTAFGASLRPYFDRCTKASSGNDPYRLSGFWPERGPFQLDQFKFPLTIFCYQKELYLVRQPGDYLKFMTTQIRNGAPEARVFMGGRPIRLQPYRVPKAEPPKKPQCAPAAGATWFERTFGTGTSCK